MQGSSLPSRPWPWIGTGHREGGEEAHPYGTGRLTVGGPSSKFFANTNSSRLCNKSVQRHLYSCRSVK